MKKRYISILCAMIALLMVFTSCGGDTVDSDTGADTASSDVDTKETERELPDPEPGVVKTLDITWHMGAIPSYSNLKATSSVLDGMEQYSYSDVITIPHAGTTITFTDSKAGFATTDYYVFSLWMEQDGVWVPDGSGMSFPANGITSDVVSKYDDGKVVYTYVTKNNWENIRLCYRSDHTASNTPTYPAVTSEYTNTDSSYDLYKLAHSDYYTWLDENIKSVYDEDLQGLTMNILGDSYFAGDGIQKNQVWPAMIAEKYGMNFVNHGIGGSTMANFVTNKNPMVDRYQNLPDNDPDIIILEGGRNDYNVATPIGLNTDTVTTTFKGALNTLIDSLRAKYPDAMIICVTVWENGLTKNALGNVCSDYGRAMMEVCELKGVPCYNSMDQDAIGVRMTDPLFRKEYCVTGTDISHLNVKGMMKVMPVFEKFISEQWASFNQN